MGDQVMQQRRRGRSWAILGVTGALLFASCSSSAARKPLPAPRQAERAPAAQPVAPAVPPPVLIESMVVREGAPGTVVDLTASGPLVWTSYRDDVGALVVELPNSTLGQGVPRSLAKDGLVSGIVAEERQEASRPLTRLTIAVVSDVEHALSAEGNALRIELTGPQAALAGADSGASAEPMEMAAVAAPMEQEGAAPVVAPPVAVVQTDVGTADRPRSGPPPQGPAATRLEGVEVLEDGRILVTGNGEFAFSTFRLEDPARFVLDLQGAINASGASTLNVNGQLVRRVRMAQFKPMPDPTARVVFDLASDSVPEIQRNADGIYLRFATTTAASAPVASAPVAAVAAKPTADEPIDDAGEDSQQAAEAAEPVMPTPAPTPTRVAQAEPMPASAPATAAPKSSPPPPARVEPAPAPVSALVQASRDAREQADTVDFDNASPQRRNIKTKIFSNRQIGESERTYAGEPITMTLRDADLVETLRSFAGLSDLSIVVQPEVRGAVTVELNNVPWDQALEQILRINRLGYELEGTVMRIAPIKTLKEETQEQQELAAAKALQVPLRTVMRRLSYSRARDIATLLTRATIARAAGGGGGGASRNLLRGNLIDSRGLLSTRGSVVIDERTNTVIIRELPSFIDSIIAVIDELDTPEPQVMIEGRIIETTKRFTRSLGIDWGLSGEASARLGNQTGLIFPSNVSGDGGVNLITGAPNGLLNLSLGNVLNSLTLDITLQAAENEGLVRILSAPKVAVLNNERASIQSGLQIPVQTVVLNTVTTTFVNATLALEVTPHVTAEGTVLMDIDIRKREPQLALAVVGARDAPISVKQAQTRVIVRDGGTTVIGGIYQVTSGQGEDRVPGLANVPILGHLFKNKRRNEDNDELLIFITPRVINL